MLLLGTDDALALFDRARRVPQAVVVPTRLDTAILRAQARHGQAHPLLADLVPDTGRSAETAAEQRGGSRLTRRLSGLSPAERDQAMLDLVRASAAIVLAHPTPDAIDTDRTFRDLGFDSLSALELRNRLGTATGLRLPPTLVFEYRTPADLAAKLHAQFFAHPDGGGRETS
jgi:acyl carrier protein